MDNGRIDELARANREQALVREDERARLRGAEAAVLSDVAFGSVRSSSYRSDAIAIVLQLPAGEVVEVAVPACTGNIFTVGVLALTNRRLVFRRSRVFGHPDERSIPRHQIEEIDIREEPLLAQLRLKLSGGAAMTFNGIHPKQRAWEMLGRIALLDETAAISVREGVDLNASRS